MAAMAKGSAMETGLPLIALLVRLVFSLINFLAGMNLYAAPLPYGFGFRE
jgi:hypothetical protein